MQRPEETEARESNGPWWGLREVLATLFAVGACATLPVRVIARLLFARTRRMPMCMDDEVNYLTPRVLAAVEGRHAPALRTTSTALLAQTVLTSLRCALGRAPSVPVPCALGNRHFPAHYLVPFQAQPGGYLSAASPVRAERMQEVLYGEHLHAMRKQVARALGTDLGRGAIVDLGAGAGTFLRTLRAEHDMARVFGVELSPYMIAAAYAHQLDGLDDHVEMVEGTATQLPFDDESVRGVSACFVLHEMPEDETKQTLKEVARILEPGGRFVVLDCLAPHGRIAKLSARIRARVFFDPYLADYLRLDVPAYAAELGLCTLEQKALTSDVGLMVFQKPERAH